MTSSRRSSRIASKISTPANGDEPIEIAELISLPPNSQTQEPRSTRRSRRQSRVEDDSFSLPQFNIEELNSSSIVTPKKNGNKIPAKVATKHSRKYISKFLKPILRDAISSKIGTEPAGLQSWAKKLNSNILKRVSLASKKGFDTEENDEQKIDAKIVDLKQKIDTKIKHLQQILVAQAMKQKLSSLPRLPEEAYESGQFEDRVSSIGDKIGKISIELSNSTKQMEERIMSFDQTYSIIKGNIDHLLASRTVADDVDSDDDLSSSPRASGLDPLRKLTEHLINR